MLTPIISVGVFAVCENLNHRGHRGTQGKYGCVMSTLWASVFPVVKICGSGRHFGHYQICFL